MVSLGLAEGAFLTLGNGFFYAGLMSLAQPVGIGYHGWLIRTLIPHYTHNMNDGSAHRGSDEPIPGLPVVPGHAGVGYGSRGLGDGASPYVWVTRA